MCSFAHSTRRLGVLIFCLFLAGVAMAGQFGIARGVDADSQVTTSNEKSAGTVEVVKPSINLRAGPGTSFAIVGTADMGETFPVIGKNAAGTWYKIQRDDDTHAWVFASLVKLTVGEPADIPVTEDPEAISATVTTTATTAEATPVLANTAASTETTSTSAAPAVGSISAGVVQGKLLYTVANEGEKRWELWEFDFDSATSKKVGDWRMMVDVSPDGKQIAYFGAPTDNDFGGVWIMDSNLSNDRRLSGGLYPSFNPGGDRLAVMDGDGEVWIVTSDGNDYWELTSGEYPAWSPIGNAIALRSCLGGSCGIYLIDANSKDPNAKQQLTTGGSDGQPAWSPDGNRIAYISKEDGNFEIYVMNADGTKKVRLTDNPTTDGLPVWSPDGKWIAFRSDRDGAWGIYIMRADGSDVRKVTDASVRDQWFFEKMDWR